MFVAGPPDVVPQDDPLAAFEGRLGSAIWAFSTDDGTKLAEIAERIAPGKGVEIALAQDLSTASSSTQKSDNKGTSRMTLVIVTVAAPAATLTSADALAEGMGNMTSTDTVLTAGCG